MSERTPRNEPTIFERKDEHLSYAARPEATHRAGSGFERYRIRHRALPGHDLDDVDLTTTFLGRSLRAPLLVSSMTGGTEYARTVNERLARAASEAGLGMALGSGRAVLLDPGVIDTFRVDPRPPLVRIPFSCSTPPGCSREQTVLKHPRLVNGQGPTQGLALDSFADYDVRLTTAGMCA
jgi:isopentenyl-diphosphate delta-isomerase